MISTSIIIPSILYLLFLALGIFIIIQNPQRKGILYIGGGMLCGGIYILISVLSRLDFSTNLIILLSRILFIPDEIATLLWFFASNRLAIEYNLGVRIRGRTKVLFVIINLLILFLLVFTNTFVNFDYLIYTGQSNLKWDTYYQNSFLIRMTFVMIKLIVPLINFYLLAYKSKEKKIRKFFSTLLIAAFFLVFGSIVNQLHHFLRVRDTSLYNFPVNSIAILNPKLMIREIAEIARDFTSYIGYSVLLLVPYLLFTSLTLKTFQSEELFIIQVLGLSGLVILTHSSHEWIVEFFKASMKQKKIIMPSILPSDVNYALKYFSTPNKLQNSRLVKLNKIIKVSKDKKISPVEALQKVITDSIEYLKPKDTSNIRTTTRLKYEILKMIAYEAATESQIMWDLGFDVYTRSVEEKLKKEQQPRFPLSKASEYSATSSRSFKRLRKEVIEILKWKLEEG
jgi:hypothetical protein